MSWNGNDNKDPWGRNDGPPDIDEAVKQLKAKVNSIFGGGSYLCQHNLKSSRWAKQSRQH